MRVLSESVGKPPFLVAKVVAVRGRICVLCEVLLVVYMCCLLLPEWNERTRISENALLPALVTERFSYGSRIATFAKALRTHPDRATYVLKQLQTHGIPTQLQSYRTLLSKNETSRNVYGIVRASRGPSVESMLAAVALDSENVEAIAVILALATFCREQFYWARDLLFVFTEGGTRGMEAFLSAYHGEQRVSVDAERLRHHGGAIIGAFVLKTTGSEFNSLGIEFNMVNGQLPNLDFVNLMVRLGDKFGLTPSLFGKGRQSSIWDTAEVALNGIFTQAFVNSQGLHSVFGRYGISALTIHAKGHGHGSLVDVAQICEGSFRSLNNILEKFHQSYFLYILAEPRRFISVAYYMPAIGLAILPLIVSALKAWFSMVRFSLPTSYLWLHLYGLMAYTFATALGRYSYIHGAIISSSLFAFIPFYALKRLNETELHTSRFLIYLEFCLVSAAISFLNFSLSLLLSIIVVPIILLFIITPATRTAIQLKYVFGFLIHPIMLFACWMQLVYPETAFQDVVSAMRAALEEHFLFGTFLFPTLHIFLVPLWNILLQVFIVEAV